MQMLGNNVLILPDTLPEKTKGGLVIPNSSVELLPEEGVMVKVGPACFIAEAGKRVKFPRKSASVIEIDGVTHYITNENKIIYFYE
jgi:co-chaperonin GroES (HSP10)